jgi:hypothetical protein
MSASPILAIEEIAENQNNKYLTHNDAIAHLEATTNDIFTNASVGAGPVNLTESQATRYRVYVVSGGSAAFNLVFPATINGNNAKREFSVHNADTTYSVTVKPSTGTGATVVIGPGETALIYQSYQDMYALSRGVIAGSPYDVGAFIPDKPEDGGEVCKFVAVRSVAFADDFAGAKGRCSVNPTSSAVFTISKNGAGIGSMTINTSGVFSFATTGGAVSLVAGDYITLTAPTPQDATLADVAFTFKGTR